MTGESDFLVVEVVLFCIRCFHSDYSLHLVPVCSTAFLYCTLYSGVPFVLVQILGILRLLSFKYSSHILVWGIAIIWFIHQFLSLRLQQSIHYINILKKKGFPYVTVVNVWIICNIRRFFSASSCYTSLINRSDWKTVFYVDPSVSDEHLLQSWIQISMIKTYFSLTISIHQPSSVILHINLFYGCSVHFSEGNVDLHGWNIYYTHVIFKRTLMLLGNLQLMEKSEVRIFPLLP
jgi:hypothetical protein